MLCLERMLEVGGGIRDGALGGEERCFMGWMASWDVRREDCE